MPTSAKPPATPFHVRHDSIQEDGKCDFVGAYCVAIDHGPVTRYVTVDGGIRFKVCPQCFKAMVAEKRIVEVA